MEAELECQSNAQTPTLYCFADTPRRKKLEQKQTQFRSQSIKLLNTLHKQQTQYKTTRKIRTFFRFCNQMKTEAENKKIMMSNREKLETEKREFLFM
jgi:hypothetical protein